VKLVSPHELGKATSKAMPVTYIDHANTYIKQLVASQMLFHWPNGSVEDFRCINLLSISFYFCAGPMNVNGRNYSQVLASQAIRVAFEDHVAAHNSELSNNQSHDLVSLASRV
jgi:hypothetical protein